MVSTLLFALFKRQCRCVGTFPLIQSSDYIVRRALFFLSAQQHFAVFTA